MRLSIVEIQSPERLHLNHNGAVRYGASQEWYNRFMQRMGGCGPTCGSHLVWYLAQTRPVAAALWRAEPHTSGGFLVLMEQMWKYITPGLRGVNSTEMFAQGLRRFAADRGVELACETLDIDAADGAARNLDAVEDFLGSAFRQDLPVAFLNLDNGALRNLENWHWVTLVGYDTVEQRARMYDQGRRSWIDLGLWLRTIRGSGGLVCAHPAGE